MKKGFIELENGEIVKFSDIKKITKNYFSKYTDNLEPYIKIKKGEPIFKLLGIVPIKWAKKDCFKLDMFCNGRYGGWYEKYYYSLKDLFEAMMKYWGQQAGGGYYASLPIAEYTAGFLISETKDALYFDNENDAICTKPYVTLWFDDFDEYYGGMAGHVKPRRKFIIFNSNNELDEWMKQNISLPLQRIG